MKSLRRAQLINAIVPGAGLIVLHREWLGLVISALFALLAQVTIFGLWIVPSDVPRWLSFGSLWSSVLVWGLAQWLTWSQGRVGISEK